MKQVLSMLCLLAVVAGAIVSPASASEEAAKPAVDAAAPAADAAAPAADAAAAPAGEEKKEEAAK